jgi:hypothetical protein
MTPMNQSHRAIRSSRLTKATEAPLGFQSAAHPQTRRRPIRTMGTNGNGRIKYLAPVFNVTRDISHLSRWKRWLYRAVFVPFLRWGFSLGLPVLVDKDGARVDVQSIAETEAVARAIVATLGSSAFFAPNVPVNVTLPKSPVIFGGTRAPYSEVAELHEANGKREDVTFICPTTHELCIMHGSHETVPRHEVEDLYQKVKSAVAS